MKYKTLRNTAVGCASVCQFQNEIESEVSRGEQYQSVMVVDNVTERLEDVPERGSTHLLMHFFTLVCMKRDLTGTI